MNKIFYIFLLVFVSCSPLEVRKDSRISTEYKKDYHQVTFERGPRVNNVRLDGVIVDTEEKYYIEEGEYLLTYDYHPKFSFGMEVSYKKDDRNGGDGGSNKTTGPSRESQNISILENQIIKLEGKTLELNFTGEAGS